jgi:hypothetical protein
MCFLQTTYDRVLWSDSVSQLIAEAGEKQDRQFPLSLAFSFGLIQAGKKTSKSPVELDRTCACCYTAFHRETSRLVMSDPVAQWIERQIADL